MHSLRLLFWWLVVGISGVEAAVLLPSTASWHWRLADEDPDPASPGMWREVEYEGLGSGWNLSPGPMQRGLPGGGVLLPQQVGGGSVLKISVKLVKEVHQGKLVIEAGPGDAISLDGKVVATGEWEGVV